MHFLLSQVLNKEFDIRSKCNPPLSQPPPPSPHPPQRNFKSKKNPQKQQQQSQTKPNQAKPNQTKPTNKPTNQPKQQQRTKQEQQNQAKNKTTRTYKTSTVTMNKQKAVRSRNEWPGVQYLIIIALIGAIRDFFYNLFTVPSATASTALW